MVSIYLLSSRTSIVQQGAIPMHKGTPFRNESIEWKFVFSTSTDGKIKTWLYGNICSRVSTAGLEASGTSNMKFDMNSCIHIGTLDGTNVEIRQEVGEDNFFLFGDEAHEIDGLQKERSRARSRSKHFVPDPLLEEIIFLGENIFKEADKASETKR
ncbi:alpha-1,4 glucan phosphorylase L-2 isozyme, chloroplastic/amyloplastic [Tanacetum coccineum]